MQAYSAEENTEEKGRAAPVAVLYEWIGEAVFSLIAVALVFTFLFRIVGVNGDSMNNTLMNRDRLVLSVLPYTPERGDIVVVGRDAQEPLVKRVIGVAGDTVEFDEEQHKVRLNGELLDEPYVDFPTPAYDMTGAVVIPEGYVFVMGDHRDNSHDSRWDDIGPVPAGDILGRAVLRIWPFTWLDESGNGKGGEADAGA